MDDVSNPAAADGGKLGEIQEVFGASLLRSTCRLYDADGVETAIASEQSLPIRTVAPGHRLLTITVGMDALQAR